MSQYHYGQFTPEHLEKLNHGLKLYNREMYWECHELLEDYWLEDVGDQARLVYWAVIQVATALYHARDGNLAGAQGMHAKALDKLNRLERAHVETDLLKKIDWENFKAKTRALPYHSTLEDFANLKEFRFPEIDQ